MPVTCSSQTLSQGCGVGYINNFHNVYVNGYYDPSPSKVGRGGAGWKTAAFVSTSPCKAAYNELKDVHKIVYQTPKRRNNNSGRQFIFVVYDCNEEGGETNADIRWPFGRQPKAT